MTQLDRLHIKGLEFFGRHGTEPWERETGRRFVVDIELFADFTAAAHNDQLKDAFDYRIVHDRARKVVAEEAHDLIERVAGRLLDEMFAALPAQAVRVRVAKPEAPLGGVNEAAIIEMYRTRDQWEGSKTPDPTR